jgi:O-antigen/teichoic acid export membrane protein
MKPLLGALARQASPLVIGRLASAALTFALPLVLARLLDAGSFGTYKQLFLVAQTVLLTGQLGLTQSLYYFLPRGGPRRGAFVAQTLLLLGLLAAAAGLAVASLGPHLARHLGDGAIAPLATPLALLCAGLLVAAPLEAALTSEGRVTLSAICYALSDAARAALLLASARAGGVRGVAWGAAAWAALRVALLAACLGARLIPLARPRFAELARQLAYCLPFAGAIWLWVGQKQFAQYAVATRFDPATFALFAIASFHLPVVDILYAPIGEVLQVRLGRLPPADAAGRRREFADANRKLASILWPAAACAWLLGPTLLPMLFTHRYDGSVPLFLLATFEVPLWAFPVDGLLRACGETRFLFGWYAARLALTATAILGGMRVGGLGGAIIAGVTVEAISRTVLLARGRRHLGVGLADAIDRTLLGRIAAASALAAAPAWAVRHAVAGDAGLVGAAAAYGATYLGLRWALGRRGTQAHAPAQELC